MNKYAPQSLIGFSVWPSDPNAKIRITAPENSWFSVDGLWLASDPCAWIINKIYFEGYDKNILHCPTDAASFNAGERSDGSPRHVKFPMGTISPSSALVLDFESLGNSVGYPANFFPIAGHVVGDWIY